MARLFEPIVGLVVAAAAAVATATATATTVAATAATAAVTATTTAATTTAPRLARLRLVDGQRPAVMLDIMQAFNGCLSPGLGAHFDESKSFAAASFSIRDHLSTLHFTKLCEQLLQV
jgi:hypothetical protein